MILTLACHPLIHLAYAYELNNVEVATEALAVSCVDRDFLYKYVDAKQKYKAFSRSTTPTTPTTPGKPVLEILDMMRRDERFDGLFESPGYWNLPILFASREENVLEYFNLFTVTRIIPHLLCILCPSIAGHTPQIPVCCNCGGLEFSASWNPGV